MRSFVVVFLLSLVGCTRANPDFCCATEAQCAAFESDSLRPCRAGQACTNAGTCVASECDTTADCTDPNAPVCIGNLCVAACTADVDCTGAPGAPHCAPDGACVGCVDATQCSGDTNICDAEDRACRGCEHDSECPGGVCLEADGVCEADANVVFVQQTGTDAGSCTRAAPCKTFTFGMSKVSTTRRVLHIDGGSLSMPTTTYTFDKDAYIDGTNTDLAFGAQGMPVLDTSIDSVTLSGVRVTHGNEVAINVAATGTLRVVGSTVGQVTTDGGTILAARVDAVPNGGFECTNGTVSVTGSSFDAGHVRGINCQVHVDHNRFENCSGCVYARGGFAKVENNVSVATDGLADSMSVVSVAGGSTFRFNTVVNTTSVASDGVALYCDNTVDVSSNIFAYNSAHPHPSKIACPTRFSLYDEAAVTTETGGEGCKVDSLSSFFVDAANGDFHLASNSPARDSAETGTGVSDDFEGNARPPMPDIGAFEAP